MDKEFIARVIAHADMHNFPETPMPLGVGGLSLVRARQPSALMNTLYAPLLCFVLQGRKETRFGDRTVSFSAGDSLIVSINIPTVSQVMDANAGAPYVSLAIEIDLGLIRSLQAEVELNSEENPNDASIASGVGHASLASAMQRLFGLLDCPITEQRILAPLIVREIHFRILFEGHGGMLRRLSRPDSHESRINRAILKLQKDYAQPIAINDLASLAGMSASSFHEHFKAVTATTPLQFLKDLRLLIAQQKLTTSADKVSTIAFDVGYESPTQFSREYTRKFGYAPSQARNHLV